jgi:hypothetical protein
VAVKLIVDSGPLVALLNWRDAWHRWAQAVFAEDRPPVSTCEPFSPTCPVDRVT